MKNNQTSFTDDEFQEMTGVDIQSLIASRLGDMAEQVAHLHVQGYSDLADLLREEGLGLANAYDNEQTFLYLTDLTAK
jgi:hypothetical protein